MSSVGGNSAKEGAKLQLIAATLVVSKLTGVMAPFIHTGENRMGSSYWLAGLTIREVLCNSCKISYYVCSVSWEGEAA